MRPFEVPAGLPTHGPVALPFPPNGSRAHGEDIVVRSRPDAAGAWVGNIKQGHTPLGAMRAHPDGHNVVVIASGSRYLIDPEKREQISPGKANAIMS